MNTQHTLVVIEPGQHGHTKHRIGYRVGVQPSGKEIYAAIADICTSRSINDKGPISEQERANAARLAHCWNCHDELVAALQGALAQLDDPAGVWGDGRGNDGTKTGLSHDEFNRLRDARVAAARAILEKARQQ